MKLRTGIKAIVIAAAVVWAAALVVGRFPVLRMASASSTPASDCPPPNLPFPIIDVHAHILPASLWQNKTYVKGLIRQARAAGVCRVALGLHATPVALRPPTYSEEHDKTVLALYREDPDFVIPLLAGFDPADPNAPEYVESQLKTGVWKGIGELDIRNASKQTATPADSPIMMSIYRIAAKYKVPVMIHFDSNHEISSTEGAAEFVRAVAQNPATTFICAHSMPDLSLATYENCLGVFEPFCDGLPAALMQRMVVGTDMQSETLTFPVGKGKDDSYLDRIKRLRVQLSAFSSENAEKVAFRNCMRIFQLSSEPGRDL